MAASAPPCPALRANSGLTAPFAVWLPPSLARVPTDSIFSTIISVNSRGVTVGPRALNRVPSTAGQSAPNCSTSSAQRKPSAVGTRSMHCLRTMSNTEFTPIPLSRCVWRPVRKIPGCRLHRGAENRSLPGSVKACKVPGCRIGKMPQGLVPEQMWNCL